MPEHVSAEVCVPITECGLDGSTDEEAKAPRSTHLSSHMASHRRTRISPFDTL